MVIRMPGGIEGRSNPLWSRERALGLAYDLVDGGDEVLRIKGPEGNVTAAEIAAERAATARR